MFKCRQQRGKLITNNNDQLTDLPGFLNVAIEMPSQIQWYTLIIVRTPKKLGGGYPNGKVKKHNYSIPLDNIQMDSPVTRCLLA